MELTGLLSAAAAVARALCASLSDVRLRRATMPSAPGYAHVGEKEEELMRALHAQGLGVKKIAAMLGRSSDTATKHIFKKNKKKKMAPKGRPVSITPARFKKMLKVYEGMLVESQPGEVTIAMIKERLGLTCSEKTISRAFWARGIRFKPLYEKPVLESADKSERLAWAHDHKHRSPAQWNRFIHAVIDNKVFPVYTSAKHRSYAARRVVRGAYRGRRRNVSDGYIKPRKTLKQNTGHKSVMVACALGAGKVLMWHVVEGSWNGTAAARMYAGPLRRCLARQYPGVKGNWRVLEDNDPAGYKSAKAKDAKKASSITTLDLPKRSPDLNPLDFNFWAAVNRKMREEERGWPASKKESRAAFIVRLRKAARSFPSEYINGIVGAIAGRCHKVVAAKGGHIAEGN